MSGAYNMAIMGVSRTRQVEEVDHDAIMAALDAKEEKAYEASEKRRERAALKKEREKYKVDIFPIVASGDCDKLEALLKECIEKFGDDISDVGKYTIHTYHCNYHYHHHHYHHHLHYHHYHYHYCYHYYIGVSTYLLQIVSIFLSDPSDEDLSQKFRSGFVWQVK